jgi:hypothetical protein
MKRKVLISASPFILKNCVEICGFFKNILSQKFKTFLNPGIPGPIKSSTEFPVPKRWSSIASYIYHPLPYSFFICSFIYPIQNITYEKFHVKKFIWGNSKRKMKTGKFKMEKEKRNMEMKKGIFFKWNMKNGT